MTSPLEQCRNALPPLPDPVITVRGYGSAYGTSDGGGAFTADQMRDYARAALAAADAALAAQPEPVAWIGPVGQLMNHAIYVDWAAAYPDDAKCFLPIYAAPAAAPAAQPLTDQDRRDAERYRKWRSDYTGEGATDMLLELADAWEPAQVDAAIDAAMGAPKEPA